MHPAEALDSHFGRSATSDPRVQRTLDRVTALNARPLTTPTPFDRLFWSRSHYEFTGDLMREEPRAAVRLWLGGSSGWGSSFSDGTYVCVGLTDFG
jgi:hypothetical protein